MRGPLSLSRSHSGPEESGGGRGAEQRRGLIVIFSGVVMVSIDGSVIRWLDADPWSVIALRSPATAIGLWFVARMIDRRSMIAQLRNAGRWGPLVTASSVGANLLWVYALSHTAVANVLAIYAGVPIFVALLGWLLIGERLEKPTWFALGVVTISVLGLVGAGFESGGLGGDVAGLGATLSFALAVSLMRKARLSSMVPYMALAHTLLAIVAQVPADLGTFSAAEIAVTVAHGVLVLGPGIALLTYAPRLLPAGEVGLVLPLETVLGAAVAWIWLSEAPSAAALAGGATIIVTLFIHSRWSLRRAGPDPTAIA